MEPQPAQILVVDDEASIRLTLEALLRRCGYTVTLAASGEEALTQIEGRAFDLILLDLILPGMSGHAVARKACARQPEAAILMLTGSATLEGMVPVEYAYILKTASPQEVLARVTAAIVEQRALLAVSDGQHTTAHQGCPDAAAAPLAIGDRGPEAGSCA